MVELSNPRAQMNNLQSIWKFNIRNEEPQEVTEEELASAASEHTWQMFRRIYSNCGVHDALLWWKQTMEKGGYVL